MVSTFFECYNAWEATLESEIETGSFAGDAYTGGTHCETYRFDERDIAVLLESLLRADWPESVVSAWRSFLLNAGEDPDELLAHLHKLIYEASINNQYSYVLRLVSKDGDSLGLSLIVYEDDQLVSTLSLGFREENAKAILGYGLRGENYYLTLNVNTVPIDQPMMTVKLWQDQAKEGYAIVSANEKDHLLLFATLDAEADGQAFALRTDLQGALLKDIPVTITLTGITADDASALECAVALFSEPLLTTRLLISIVEELPPLETEGKQVFDLLELSIDEEIQLAKDMQSLLMQFAVRLFKLMPPELLTYTLWTDMFLE